MNSKLYGGILLVIGTTIGAGMLALPIATAQLGFFGSMILLIVCWAVMTACAFLFLEVNLWLPPNTNLISMAGATLGKHGQAVSWFFYLVLLYSIISAYIAGGGDLFHYVLQTGGINTPIWLSSIVFTFLFGMVVYCGMRSVDYVNRGLMFAKMGALLFLIILILPFVSGSYLSGGELKHFISPSSMTVTAVSFGSLMIIPSLRTYFGEDIKSLRKAIFIGMLIPLFCYIAWDLVIMGVVPLEGTPGLEEMGHSATSNSDLVAALTHLLQRSTITALAKFFTSICMATSFLSVSLSLSDFLSDGLGIAKKGLGTTIIIAGTFLPPLLVVLFYPNAFLYGLNYAGICCFVLMVMLPPLMVWRGRYHRAALNKSVNGETNDKGNYELVYSTGDTFQVPGGKLLLALLVLFATLMIGFGLEGAI